MKSRHVGYFDRFSGNTREYGRTQERRSSKREKVVEWVKLEGRKPRLDVLLVLMIRARAYSCYHPVQRTATVRLCGFSREYQRISQERFRYRARISYVNC